MEASLAKARFRVLAEVVKQGIWSAGGVPFEFGEPATCGNVTIGTEDFKYELGDRDVVSMSIEFVAKVHLFGGSFYMRPIALVEDGDIISLDLGKT